MRFLRHRTIQRWIYPLALLLLCVGAYGLFITKMGFYWDDWQAIFLSHFHDPQAYSIYYSTDRPLSAWTYQLMMPVLGLNPIAWQAASIIIRWLGGVGLWLVVRGLWPERKEAAGWVAALFVVYPGFLQQPIAVAYSQHLITYALFLFSLAAMVWAMRIQKYRIWLLAASFVTAALQMATMEYFAGMELIRPILLWVVLHQPGEYARTTIRRLSKVYLPFLLLFLLFLVWRFYLFPTLIPDSMNQALWLDDLKASPVTAIMSLFEAAFLDTAHMLLFVWLKALLPEKFDLLNRVNLFALFVSTAAAVFMLMVGRIVTSKELDDESQKGFYWQTGVIGFAAILLGGLTFWVTNVRILQGTWSDRFTLGPMFGVVILVVAGLTGFARTRLIGRIALAFLVIASMTAQILNTYTYRQNWKTQRDFYTELAWRVPGLKPGTTVLTQSMPFNRVAEYSMSYGMNVLYSTGVDSFDNPPLWYLSALNHRGGSIEDYQKGLGIYDKVRMVTFSGTTSESILFKYVPEEGCLRLIGEYDRNSPDLSEGERDLIAISNPGQVLTSTPEGIRVPHAMFLPEMERTWCYYYEKADLARYNLDWDRVVALWGEAQQLGYRPNNSMEYVPFIEGFAMKGDWNSAEALTNTAVTVYERPEMLLCDRWDWLSVHAEITPEGEDVIQHVKGTLGCSSAP